MAEVRSSQSGSRSTTPIRTLRQTTRRAAVGLGVGWLLLLSGAAIANAGTSGVTGCWKTVSDKDGKLDSIVCIEERNGELVGKITKLFDPDEPNPLCEKCKGNRKNKPIIGMTILWGMKKHDDVWKGGKILDPENGETYACVIWREGEKLKVRGYLAFFYRTQTWIK